MRIFQKMLNVTNVSRYAVLFACKIGWSHIFCHACEMVPQLASLGNALYMYRNFISHWLWGCKFNMLGSYGATNCKIYDDTKTTFPTIVDFYNNISDIQIFTAIHVTLKLHMAMQNKKVGKSRNFGEKVGKIGKWQKSRKK